jgi:hypothetical protein
LVSSRRICAINFFQFVVSFLAVSQRAMAAAYAAADEDKDTVKVRFVQEGSMHASAMQKWRNCKS